MRICRSGVINGMKELLEKLCRIDAVSGGESALREFLIKEIGDDAELKTDALGNLTAFKKGEKRPLKKVMVDAHMDEVGLIITGADESGFLKFETVGGIEPGVLAARAVRCGNVSGATVTKPIHLLRKDEADKPIKKEDIVIDIGAKSREEALAELPLGSLVAFAEPPFEMGSLLKAKAIDDRAGVAVLLNLLKQPAEYDFYATFTTGEEIGCRGAAAAAYSVDPDICLVLEATTAADICGVPEEDKVCRVGGGVTLSFMDNGTLYDKELFEEVLSTARENGIPHQIKSAVAGGNNSGKIHISRGGVKTAALSVPCRYIHSPSSVADTEDVKAVQKLVTALLPRLCK